MSKTDTHALVEDGLSTIPEASEFTRLSRSTLYKMMDNSELKYCKIGRRRLIPRKALLDLAARGLVGVAG
jgi:excisionase family DNA binding protein